MPPVGGGLTAELRHKSENAHRRSHLLRGVGRVVPMCAVLWADRASVQVCATQTPRLPTVRRNHNHRPCRWFAQAPLGPITSRTYRFIESSFYCMMRPTAIEIAAWRILLFVSPWLSVFLNHTLSPAFQTCSSLRSDIFSGHS